MTTKTDITLPPPAQRIPYIGDLWTRDQIRAAIEADRADHLRGVTKMVPSDELRSRADAAYSAYIQQMRSRECLGWERKVKTGKFGEAELKAHTKAGEFLGRHRAFSECADMLSRYGSSQPAYGHSGTPMDISSGHNGQPAASAEPCPICFEDEPHTGTCGSSNPRALCNQPAAPVAQEQVPIPWQDVRRAIVAVHAESKRRGDMYPQTSEDRADDRKAVHRVVDMIEWYTTKGGAVAENLPDWPTYTAPVAAQAQPVAFAKDGVLFWHGEHAAWRGFNGDLYLAAQVQPDAKAIRNAALEDAARLIETTNETTTVENGGETQRHLTQRKGVNNLNGLAWADGIRALKTEQAQPSAQDREDGK
ncbi:hypothetical protein [Castellaniella sp.]|uniref:hypothetical protein n=1 Tax=Castellaniella sp. TaxID=1955812 RepID=UPI003C74A7BC